MEEDLVAQDELCSTGVCCDIPSSLQQLGPNPLSVGSAHPSAPPQLLPTHLERSRAVCQLLLDIPTPTAGQLLTLLFLWLSHPTRTSTVGRVGLNSC